MKILPEVLLDWMKESLTSFRAQLILRNSESTVEGYCHDMVNFFRYLLEIKVRRMKSIKAIHIEDYLGYCKERGKSDASVNRYYMSIRSYCNFLKRNKYMDNDLLNDVQPPRNKLKAPRIPSLAEVNHLLEQPDTQQGCGLRDRAILELLYSSGLRASELCNVKRIDKQNGCITVTGKGDKVRTVPITETAEHWIDEYLNYREDTEGWLFVNNLDRQLTRQAVFKMIVHYVKLVGLQQLTPHTLRHACATHLLDAGADLVLIQELLGHASITSTRRYTHLSGEKMKERFNALHPRR